MITYGAVPGQMALAGIRKQAEQVMESKSESIIPS